ncbi:hypothetical protein AB0F17_43110 [Nonomuraea sp. NPDC026600]|uniref:DUF7167 family protein n=1 Tax=Nonomuraea sp. NPDC026600 TaxID=3155363 RepID=UPI0033CA77E7
MYPETKHMKDTVAVLGIPRRAIHAVTDLGDTHATVLDPTHRNLIADHAHQLATPRYGVIIWRYPCGCPSKVRVTTDRRHTGRVHTIATTPYNEHHCPQNAINPGHCDDCALRSRIAAHGPNLECRSVRCSMPHLATDTDTVKLEFDVSTEKHGSKVSDTHDTGIPITEWDAMTPEQRKTYGDREYREWMMEQLEGGWELAKRDEKGVW